MFSSKDALSWKFETILDRCRLEYGKMWECPDFFPLDGQQVLITSPQFMDARGLEFHNGNNSVYFFGSYHHETKEFVRDKAYQIDYGMDFYAPQTVEAADGRRIMIGWLASWDNYLTPEELAWSGMMTIPRELSVKKGKLIQVPVRELEQYRRNKVMYENIRVAEKPMFLEDVNGRCLDMTVTITSGDYEQFTITLAGDGEHKTLLSYEPKKGIVTTDRTWCGMTRDMLTKRSMYAGNHSEKIKLRILMDKYSIEVFVNDGEQAMTTLIYTPLTAEEIAFSCDKMAVCTIEKYDIIV